MPPAITPPASRRSIPGVSRESGKLGTDGTFSVFLTGKLGNVPSVPGLFVPDLFVGVYLQSPIGVYPMGIIATPEPVLPLSSILDVVDKATKVIALLVGGAWAYLNYIRGRTFKKRLELKIAAKELKSKECLLLAGSVQMKNVGLSKFPVEQTGTAILLFDLIPALQSACLSEPLEESIGVREVFKNHAWIEPGETIAEDFLLQIPERVERLAIKLELRVVAAHIEWNANCIVGLPDESPHPLDKGAVRDE